MEEEIHYTVVGPVQWIQVTGGHDSEETGKGERGGERKGLGGEREERGLVHDEDDDCQIT